MQTETLSFNNIYENIKISPIIGTILLICTPLLIIFLVTRYLALDVIIFFVVYLVCSFLETVAIMAYLFNFNTESDNDIKKIFGIIILRIIYITILIAIAYGPLYSFLAVKPFNNMQIKNMVMPSFKHYAIYQNVPKKLNDRQINKLVNLKYIKKYKEFIKQKSLINYKKCLHNDYINGINQAKAKNECSKIYTLVKTYKYVLTKKGSKFFTLNNKTILVNAAYQNFILKKEPIKSKLIFKIFDIKRILFDPYSPRLIYSAHMDIYSPTTKFYYKLTGKKYILIGRKILELNFSGLYNFLFLNLKLSKITVS